MISQEFTVEALNRLRRRGGQFKYQADDGSHPKTAGEWKEFLKGVQVQILDDTFLFRPFDVVPLPVEFHPKLSHFAG